ncbi:glyoxalase [Kitasatospora sp. NPDC002227]|uniref:glyoxalase n=1 Tax=Kitasatospora sp. NPDC002227 TaxID=3154773 RepID=UPI003325E113
MTNTTAIAALTALDSVTLEVADVEAAHRFYSAAFGLDDRLRLRATDTPSTGFRGFTLSLTVARPGNVDAYFAAAVAAGATVLKPAGKSLWGYGGSLQAPDGTIWKIATSAKKDSGPAVREFEEFVLLIGVADVTATKKFYVERGLTVAKSFGKMYVEFAAEGGRVKLGLYRRKALAKDAGVPAEGGGSHRLVIGGAPAAFTDPDGFAWAPAL